MIKNLFSALVVVLFATSVMAQTGLTCDDPIHVDKNYKGHVEVDPEVGYTELWYTASTYDLPLHVYFSPDSAGSVWSPEVYVDFTCEPGVYADTKLDSLLNKMSLFGVALPIEFLCDAVFRNDKREWDLSVSKTYREQLAEAGITYNVQAYVRVVYYESGSISLTPDSSFTSCMDNEYVALGDTIDILPNDSDRVFVMPYTDWQKDSIQLVWVGEQEANVWVAVQECEFTPTSQSNYAFATYTVSEGNPYKLQKQQIIDIIKDKKNGGIYYGKIISPVAGKFVIEKIPMAPIQGGATLLEYGQPVNVNDANQLFCFPRTWGATEFMASTNAAITMYMAATPDFTPSIEDSNLITYHAFTLDAGTYYNYISNKEMTEILKTTNSDYIYVRFQSAVPTTIVPNVWVASLCANNSLMIRPNQSTPIAAKSQSTIYRLLYDDFKNCNVVIEWDGNSTLPTYIADTCSFVASSTSPNVLKYASIKRKGTLELDNATIQSWASRVDGDGYLYVCFNPTNKGNVTFVANKIAGSDPVYTNESAAICFGDTYEWNGQTYSETGKYTYTTVAANGADSIVTLTLTVYPQTEATTEKVEIPFGETYDWHGVTYTESGEYTITLQDENGCDYQATLILTVEEEPVSPCVAASTLLEPVAELTLNLGNAFDIYRIDYQAWLASGVNLVWTGKGALHTFVAKDCEFAVAIYHKDVVNYTEVPAEGNVILSKAILAPLAQYVDADGYLYVRFLTEFEGQLTTALAE